MPSLCRLKVAAGGKVLASKMSEQMKAELVLSTVRKTVRNRHLPGGGSIFHRDRGSQYTSEEMTKYISRTGLRQSFSGKDIPGGNFRSESFFANLKEGHGPLGPRNIGQRTKEIFFRGLSGM